MEFDKWNFYTINIDIPVSTNSRNVLEKLKRMKWLAQRFNGVSRAGSYATARNLITLRSVEGERERE